MNESKIVSSRVCHILIVLQTRPSFEIQSRLWCISPFFSFFASFQSDFECFLHLQSVYNDLKRMEKECLKWRLKYTYCSSSPLSYPCLTTWTDAKSCPHPSVPLYAQVILSDPVNLRTGSTASYRCDDGYELFGSSVRSCSQSGKWSGDLPYCGEYGMPHNHNTIIMIKKEKIRNGKRNGNQKSIISPFFHKESWLTSDFLFFSPSSFCR